MAREVIKRVGARAYRYRVESYREGEKVRARWTYLGVVRGDELATTDSEAARTPAPLESGLARHDRSGIPATSGDARRSSRGRLIDAFERLAERESYAAITADAVATEAGLAHGTFYRYFKNKREILVAALDRVREAFDRVRPSFDPPYGDLTCERARVRDWTRVLGTKLGSRGVIAAWFDALESDAELEAARLARFAERRAALGAYLEGLARDGTIAVGNAQALATALMTLFDATFRAAIAAGSVDPDALLGVSEVFDRAIFQAPAGPQPTVGD